MGSEQYTTILERQQGLGDVYFLSCLRSTEGEHSEVSLLGGKTVVKVMLVTSLLQPGDMFASEIKSESSFQKEVPELVDFSSIRVAGNRPNLVQEGQVSLEVKEMPSYRYRTKRVLLAEQEQLERAQRVQLLLQSWNKNKQSVQPSYMARWFMRRTNLALSQLPYSDAILQYVSYDDIWHYNLFFPGDLEMSVSVYVDDEPTDSVDFSVYHKGELVVANMLPLRSLVKKMKSVLSKYQVNG